MGGLSAEGILSIWETGQPQSPIGRALAMVAAICPDLTPHELSELDIARRDALLFELREKIFGKTLRGISGCSSCSLNLEFTLSMEEIGDLKGACGRANTGAYEALEGYPHIRFRLPDSVDLAIAARHDDVTARALVLERCVAVEKAEELTDEVREEIVAKMAERAPLSDIVMNLVCPDCGGHFAAPLDIASFLWSEISAEAKRIFYEIHLLARAYGWAESDILRMNPARRAFYVDMVSS